MAAGMRSKRLKPRIDTKTKPSIPHKNCGWRLTIGNRSGPKASATILRVNSTNESGLGTSLFQQVFDDRALFFELRFGQLKLLDGEVIKLERLDDFVAAFTVAAHRLREDQARLDAVGTGGRDGHGDKVVLGRFGIPAAHVIDRGTRRAGR